MKKNGVLSLTAALMLVASTLFAQQDFSKVEMKTTEITPHIFMLEGSGGNIGMFKSEDVTFIIDDQYAPLYAKIVGAVAKVTSRQIDFVINTHSHGDHAGSNSLFEDDGTYIVAQKNVRTQLISEDKTEGLPKITFDKSMTFHFGEEEIEVFHQSRAHTNGDAIIHFKTSNVFHMGDVYVQYGFPFVDINRGGNINGMIEFLDAATAKMNERSIIIPGHGQIAKKSEVLAFRNMLMGIKTRVQSGITAGLTLEEIKAFNPTEGYDGQGRSGDDFVTVVYTCLTEK
jgi:glyoxylase-like metal-dependent hydrolase (beta-lactamase superfamily II)